LEHVCFFGTALLFWRAVLDARTSRRAAPALAAAFVTFMHSGLLGGLITLAPHPLYAVYVGRSAVWGLTALDDQQLAGLLMWVPLGLPYLTAGLFLASRLVFGHPDEAAAQGTSALSSSGT
jgi:putative membrane protein